MASPARPLSRRARAIAPVRVTRAPAINIVVRGLLYLTVASFPFEMPDLQLRWQLPQLTSSLFLVGTLLQPVACYRRVPRPTWWFLGFLYLFLALVAVHDPIDKMNTAQYFILLVQALALFVAGANLLRDERVARGALWAMAVGAFLWALFPMLDLGRTSDVVWTGGARVTAFGQNANRAALLIALGFLALLGLTYGPSPSTVRSRLLAWPALIVMALAVVETGSRGGLLSLTAGLLTFVGFQRTRSVASHLRTIAVGVVALAALAVTAARTEVMRHRLEATAQTGTMAGREDLFPALWDMFLERPLAGWGPVNNQYEVAVRAPGMDKVKRDAHNLLLELLTATGVIGTIPFLVGLALCVAAAWRARHGSHGVLPLALLAALAAANMSGNHLAFKPLWFGLALAVAAASLVRQPAPRIA